MGRHLHVVVFSACVLLAIVTWTTPAEAATYTVASIAELQTRLDAAFEGTDVPEPLEDAVRNMECIDALFRSAESGRWKTVT
jgi:hypothetical protein